MGDSRVAIANKRANSPTISPRFRWRDGRPQSAYAFSTQSRSLSDALGANPRLRGPARDRYGSSANRLRCNAAVAISAHIPVGGLGFITHLGVVSHALLLFSGRRVGLFSVVAPDQTKPLAGFRLRCQDFAISPADAVARNFAIRLRYPMLYSNAALPPTLSPAIIQRRLRHGRRQYHRASSPA